MAHIINCFVAQVYILHGCMGPFEPQPEGECFHYSGILHGAQSFVLKQILCRLIPDDNWADDADATHTPKDPWSHMV